MKYIAYALICSVLSPPNIANAETAKEAWNSLISKNFKNRPEFQYISNDVNLPNVLLYGDSISIHYTKAVRNELHGKVNLYRLFRNGGESASFIPKMKKMHSTMNSSQVTDNWSFNWDIIHFNVGLHDLKYIKGKNLDKVNGNQVSSIKDYQNNLTNIIHYLKNLSPNSQLIFATTTPVPEGAKGRIAGDSAKYNNAALEVLKSFPEIQINDLYALTKPNQPRWWIKPGDVHYNELGSTIQGNETAKIIIKTMQLR